MPLEITNKDGIPQEIVNAVKMDRHRSSGDISVTQLIDSPYIRMLKRGNSYSKEASMMIAALFGTALHTVIEQGKMENGEVAVIEKALSVLDFYADDDPAVKKVVAWIRAWVANKFDLSATAHIHTEKHLRMEVDGLMLTGTFDRYDEKLFELSDYKSTKTFAFTDGDARKKFDKQLNVYAVMMRVEGFEVKTAKINFLFTDWSKMKALRQRMYPQVPITSMAVSLYDNDKVMEYIRLRVKMHKETMDGTNIHYCTPEDKWSSEEVFAVMKKGGKRSLKNHSSKSEANLYLIENQEKHKTPTHASPLWIEHRPSTNMRCDHYCDVSDICPIKAAHDKLVAEAEQEKLKNSL